MRRGGAQLSRDTLTTPATDRREKTVGAMVRQRGARLCRMILREGRRLELGSSGNAFHDLRKNCKKLSYLMALFPDIFPADELALLARKLKRVQRNLGAHQDIEVQMTLIQRFLRDSAESNVLPALERIAVEKLIGRYREAKTALRSEFFAHFQRIQRDKTRERLRALFKTRPD
jgi:CHAD domain-containing protein